MIPLFVQLARRNSVLGSPVTVTTAFSSIVESSLSLFPQIEVEIRSLLDCFVANASLRSLIA